MNRRSLLRQVADFYRKSRDFNGIPIRLLVQRVPSERLRDLLSELISCGLVSVNFGDRHPNPHINAFAAEPKDEQLVKLRGPLFEGACAYPTPKHLDEVVDRSSFAREPYRLCLALGEPQLSHRSFDLMVLENYRNDPRYHYWTDDIHGDVLVADASREAGDLRSSDQISLQFGFCYDAEGARYVAVFLHDLAGLSAEHQQVWAAREVSVETQLPPDYIRTDMLAELPERASVFVATTEEMKIINAMAQAMSRPHFFCNDFSGPARPREFAWLIRPTAREFRLFVHVLDKMLSENIDRDFFQKEVPYETERTWPDGRVEVRPKRTVQILEDWLQARFRTKDPDPMREMLVTFRHVRGLRARPAHVVEEDVFDQQYVEEQRKLMTRVYCAVRTLRLLFANHPAARSVEVPTEIRDGLICLM